MSGHEFANLAPVAIVVLFIIGAIRRQLARGVARSPIVPQPPAAAKPAAPIPPRRRLAPALAPGARPVMPPVLPAAARVMPEPAMPQAMSAESAFPTIDLSLPGTVSPAAARARRRIRTIGGGPPLGSPAWGANALLALEILGPPVSLRSGATLGAPHAF